MLIRYLGICRMKDGEYQQAEKLFMEVVKRLDHADDRTEHYRRELSACHHDMGICYIRQKKWDMASGCLKGQWRLERNIWYPVRRGYSTQI